jgi:predicted MFS family arabinose efflux permease
MAGMFSAFFFASLYMQSVLGYSPVKTGLSFLVIPFAIAISAINAPRLVKKIGFKPILTVAPLITASALFWLTHIRVGGNFVHDLLPAFILMGLGMGATFIAITIAATTGVSGKESGLASGLLSTAQQIGGAVGLAILTGVSTSAAISYVKNLTVAPDKLTPLAAEVHGFHAAFYLATGFMIAASLLATVLIKQKKVSKKDMEAAMTSAG